MSLIGTGGAKGSTWYGTDGGSIPVGEVSGRVESDAVYGSMKPAVPRRNKKYRMRSGKVSSVFWKVFAGLACVCAATVPIQGSFWGYEGARDAYHGVVWREPLTGFSQRAYDAAVATSIARFEADTGKRLEPADRGKAGLKIYTASRLGMSTPRALVEAVIRALVQRGFSRADIYLVDAREDTLRHAGFLPPLSQRMDGEAFNGARILPLDRGTHYDPVWKYDSPVPRQQVISYFSSVGRNYDVDPIEDRRESMLPAPLILDVDFWVNLPVAVHHPTLGLSGAVANGSLWAVSNRGRFLQSRTSGPAAAAEILAVPELISNQALTILSLEHYQYIAGPSFNALYSRSEPLLLTSPDPVIIDAIMLERINDARVTEGFKALEKPLPIIDYASTLGLGESRLDSVTFR